MNVATARLVVVAAALGAAVSSAAQELPQQDRSARPITESLERIASDMRAQGAAPTTGEDGRAVFRSGVTIDEWPALPPAWQLRPGRQPPRGRYGEYQRELLSAMTPPDLRGSTFHTPGISIDPGAVINRVRKTWRGWRERRIHDRVEEEVAQLRALTKRPDP
jgi:hypothetical protein